jgi:hypothetical protein
MVNGLHRKVLTFDGGRVEQVKQEWLDKTRPQFDGGEVCEFGAEDIVREAAVSFARLGLTVHAIELPFTTYLSIEPFIF